MKDALVKTTILSTVLVLFALSAIAAPPIKHSKGLLWEIAGKDSLPSYLFGTIHSSDPRVLKLPGALTESFDRSASFSMELIFTGADFVTLAETMFFNEDQTLEAVLGKELYAQTKQAVSEQGLPIEGLNKKKPWAVMMILSTPRGGGMFLDLMLQFRATMQLKPTFALETMEEQLTVFDGLSMDEQVALLKDTLHQLDQADAQMKQLMRAYLQRDLAALMALSEQFQSESGPAYRKLLDRLLAQRNHRMVQRMQPRLEEGNAFIAVGALHLPGPEGILNLLEQQGYQVRALY